MEKGVEEQFGKIRSDEAKAIILKQQMRTSELKTENESLRKGLIQLQLKIAKIETWKTEAENYKYGDGLDTQEINDKLAEILK